MKNNKTITIEKTAELLNISTATVHNWVRSGLLIKENHGINTKSFEKLNNSIISGKTNRLNSRANKKTSARTFIPDELLENKNSEKEILSLLSQIKDSDIDKFILELLKDEKLSINPEILYQSLKSEGGKSKEGSYYTPSEIITDILDDHNPKRNSKIYDPCCGTGQFLKTINNKCNEVQIYGTDIDFTAIKIAEHYLKAENKNKFTLRNLDSLKIIEKNKYDIIVTNPPWGAHYSKVERKILDEIFPEADSGDSLEYFLLKGYHSLKKNGIMSFVLPESFLYVKRFSGIRKFFLDNSKILKIKIYGRKFAKVFSEIIRIDIQKSKTAENHEITIETDQKIKQSYFINEFDYRYNINTSEKERKILKNIFSKQYVTLKDNAKWSLGIVTGNNAEFVSSEKTTNHTLPLVTGKNIDYFTIKGSVKYLTHNFKKLQQVPKNNLYEAKENLIYKFISNKLVFAYDNTGKYTLNSANVLIPELKDYPIKVVMAILNSDIINFIYHKKFNSLKVLRSNIERLPFPMNSDKKIIKEIEKKVDEILDGKYSSKNIIDELVNQLYGISDF
ncbi:MAG: N-6 DNA methylase [Candidatus Delongbacteria bacterium]|jgi:type I restriction-modification system DNA methylase subunit|nr:N-6 DNA methylase [Candidatus Delongbacteria bacterium]